MSNIGRALANTDVYDSFGNLASSTGTATNPYQYTGRDYDQETGLRYYRARYYDSTMGHFISEDPIGFDGDGNFYVYTANNPTNWADPDGLRRVLVCRQPLRAFGGIAGWFWNHTYIKIVADYGTVIATFGILGPPPNHKNPQLPQKNDPRNNGKDCKPSTNRGCGNYEDKIDTLLQALNNSWTAQSCPSCTPNYHAWIATDLVNLFDGYNSNTYTYNMIYGAGLQPPPESRSPGYHRAPGNWYPK